MLRERLELATVGFDDFAGLAGDPWGGANRTGIRLPALPGVMYRVLGASAQLDEGDVVTHLRQFLTIGAQVPGNSDEPSSPPSYAVEKDVTSPTWRFPDGWSVWTITLEPLRPPRVRAGQFDSQSFAYDDSDSPALLYETAAFAGGATAPGYLGLTGYTPPAMRGTVAMVFRDMRNPWALLHPKEFRIPIVRPTKVRVYCDVLQTNPGTREIPVLFTPTVPVYVIEGLRPEDQTLQLYRSTLRYWATGCALGITRRRIVEADGRVRNERGA